MTRGMHRRAFLQASAAAPLAFASEEPIPNYRVVSPFRPAARPGMPGPYPGFVASVHAEKSIDAKTEKVGAPTVREMLARGMRALTGESTVAGAWRTFFS
ncbi:MAG: hypothetical protein HY236_18290, partial [Acidobacteria bacterium]|nr:hypothetical protein [Acidobacteriota bacterium]